MTWNEVAGVEWCISDALILMERNEVTQFGLRMENWNDWKWSEVEWNIAWYGV